jgi:hypothetical protein
MTELSTFTRNRQGSPFAAELDAGLPVTSRWPMSSPGGGRHIGNGASRSRTRTMVAPASWTCLGGVWSLTPGNEPLTEDNSDPDVQKMWGFVRKDRETLRAARTGDKN